jgi:Ca-activated chloride channel homolog
MMASSVLPSANAGDDFQIGFPRLGPEGLENQAESPGFQGQGFIQGDRLLIRECSGDDAGGHATIFRLSLPTGSPQGGGVTMVGKLSAVLLALFLPALLFSGAQSAAAAPVVSLAEPPPGQPLFGAVEIRADVRPAGSPVRRVELYFDHLGAGVREAPPYRWTVDAGQENREHHIEVVAWDASGASAAASLTTPALRADMEIEVRLQQLFVNLERNGVPLAGLGRDDFKIFDDGVPQQTVTFEHGDIPFTAVLLLDGSTSMEKPQLATAIDGVRSFARAMNRLDEAKLLLFDDHVLLETPFTSVSSILTLGLSDLEAQGGTSLNDALYVGLKRLDDRLGRKVVVLLSDGIDVESVLPMKTVREIVRRSQAALYWFRLRPSGAADDGPLLSVYSTWRDAEGHRREMEELRAAVLESGGRVDTLQSIADVPAALKRLLGELRGQYVLGYAPSVHHGAGAWHEIKLEVRGAPGARVRVQEGYLEKASEKPGS